MAGNLKAFTMDELKFFLSKYDISLNGDSVVVRCKGMDRATSHPASRGFVLSTRVKKINITAEAISYWRDDQSIGQYSLIEVQNAINTLKITYQRVNQTQLLSELKRIKSLANNSI